eukprot:TRINITY_DN12951_c0_g1_i5.p1 TRINITY_DN12951_c0_g1~~TRINITY_DN12951_c0_g1_i5.p1  ORF type:complete len:288 (-),score=76.69 TRINITY_DN12951_c0_g1_i5:516-1379(-)
MGCCFGRSGEEERLLQSDDENYSQPSRTERLDSLVEDKGLVVKGRQEEKVLEKKPVVDRKEEKVVHLDESLPDEDIAPKGKPQPVYHQEERGGGQPHKGQPLGGRVEVERMQSPQDKEKGKNELESMPHKEEEGDKEWDNLPKLKVDNQREEEKESLPPNPSKGTEKVPSPGPGTGEDNDKLGPVPHKQMADPLEGRPQGKEHNELEGMPPREADEVESLPGRKELNELESMPPDETELESDPMGITPLHDPPPLNIPTTQPLELHPQHQQPTDTEEAESLPPKDEQ